MGEDPNTPLRVVFGEPVTYARDRASDGEVVRHKLTPRLDGLWGGGAMRSRECDEPLVVRSNHIE
jgi:hypothetical protein